MEKEQLIALLKEKINLMVIAKEALKRDYPLDEARLNGVLYAYNNVLDMLEDEEYLNDQLETYKIEKE